MAQKTNFAFEVNFAANDGMRIMGADVRLYRQDPDGWHDVTDTSPLPKGVSGPSLVFNVRYRAFAGQKTKDSPIVGVLKTPLALDK